MEYIQIGKISNVHGVKGDLKVIPLTDNMKRYDELSHVLIGMNKDEYEIETVSYSKNQIILKLKGIDDIKSAEKLRNSFLWIDKEDAILPEGAFFLFDIIGIDVLDTEGNIIGKVRDVIQSGANDIYVIKSGENDYMIPAVKEFVKQIDIDEKRMVIDPIEGMLE